MLKKTTFAAATAALATFAVAGSALAASPLAQYSQAPGANGPSLSYTDGTFSTPAGGFATQFNFQAAGLPMQNLSAIEMPSSPVPKLIWEMPEVKFTVPPARRESVRLPVEPKSTPSRRLSAKVPASKVVPVV